MLAAPDEKQTIAATLWFNIAHYALRPWPWILVALASLIVYPELADIRARFPHLEPSIVRHDLAYPAMLVFVPYGMLGLIVASLAAAYMSTISTHLNWGASYLVDDVYRCFIRPAASEQHYVNVGRGVTVALMLRACLVALCAQECDAGISDPVPDRGGHWAHFSVALVLVAHQCLGRDCCPWCSHS
jgi:solute:Na+ symporter, SSS family